MFAFLLGFVGGAILTSIVYFLNYWLECFSNEDALWMCILLFFILLLGFIRYDDEEPAMLLTTLAIIIGIFLLLELKIL